MLRISVESPLDSAGASLSFRSKASYALFTVLHSVVIDSLVLNLPISATSGGNALRVFNSWCLRNIVSIVVNISSNILILPSKYLITIHCTYCLFGLGSFFSIMFNPKSTTLSTLSRSFGTQRLSPSLAWNKSLTFIRPSRLIIPTNEVSLTNLVANLSPKLLAVISLLYSSSSLNLMLSACYYSVYTYSFWNVFFVNPTV